MIPPVMVSGFIKSSIAVVIKLFPERLIKKKIKLLKKTTNKLIKL